MSLNQVNVLEACKSASVLWKNSFNNQDASGCAQQYSEGATMLAKPFGVFEGREQIQLFWQGIIDQGFNNVEYHDTEWLKEGEDGYLLTSKWSMNKAHGLIHKEHWRIQADGAALLEYDEFEVL
ncbi:isochorismatase [Piscirickettsia salmonis]|uniref:Isochorismatase n=1 Tax=Piscirickettsia salmonis TaxID=1238 RepID=A0A095BEZ9_PISSA|nr:isochorismatase [Piscirickettsia salmonis]RNC76696.1 isochorismatase [Piscirickettsiaceae bacterium NZ-RLO2]AKP72364.1 isochorismatase [Piscirickettsia salmonis LF-89 = ATCC VR-1361]ALA23640.1 isochorismatase [Piscirickettsia salmonis]ALB24183.1 isochorismatase [Piscirickettsia salmonis]ALY03985.1 isochorismatase [Piscirickettsia salmonis]